MVQPRTGKLSALTGIRDAFVVQEYEPPKPRPGTPVVRTPDAYVDEGRWPYLRSPVMLGHETVRIVEALGDGAVATSSATRSGLGTASSTVVYKGGRLPFRELVPHRIPTDRVGDAIHCPLNGYAPDDEPASTIAIAPNGLEVTNDGGADDANSGV